MTNPSASEGWHPRLSRRTASRVFLGLGILGVLLVVTDVILIVLEPADIGPYFVAFAGACSALVGFVSFRMIRVVMAPGGTSASQGEGSQ